MSRQWTKKLNINKYTSLYADSRGNRDLMKLRQWQQRKKKPIGLMSKTSILNQQEC